MLRLRWLIPFAGSPSNRPLMDIATCLCFNLPPKTQPANAWGVFHELLLFTRLPLKAATTPLLGLISALQSELRPQLRSPRSFSLTLKPFLMTKACFVHLTSWRFFQTRPSLAPIFQVLSTLQSPLMLLVQSMHASAIFPLIKPPAFSISAAFFTLRPMSFTPSRLIHAPAGCRAKSFLFPLIIALSATSSRPRLFHLMIPPPSTSNLFGSRPPANMPLVPVERAFPPSFAFPSLLRTTAFPASSNQLLWR
uniref:Uncharacterized protein n=1 Tax=Broom forkmoss associated tymo-like virus TaxID=2933121 RepID=A0A9C7GWI6_9VIRU|nr:hypothetical protein [Broom forkmoss associated tymo-like virus]CAI5383901.1 hypothetical protein [Broom forkmoss associated tymo-like virus]